MLCGYRYPEQLPPQAVIWYYVDFPQFDIFRDALMIFEENCVLKL